MRKIIFLFTFMMLSVGLWAQKESVSYRYPVYNIEDNPASGIKEWKEGTMPATVITSSNEKITWHQGWYVVIGTDVQLKAGAVCNGAVHLILADGAKLTATGVQELEISLGTSGIQVSGDGNSLAIYAQSIGDTMGQLIANGKNNAAGIGGEWNGFGSNITINGGTVTAIGGRAAAGIGGGTLGSGSNIIINGGVITAIGGGELGGAGAGIGGGASGDGSNITINGGTVTATGGDYSSDGIGGGDGSSGSNIIVATNYSVKVDDTNPPTMEIENDGTDLASKLAGKQYVTIVDLTPYKAAAIAEINTAVEGITDAGILSIANTAKDDIQDARTEAKVDIIKTQALTDIKDAILTKAQLAAIEAINTIATTAKSEIDAASSYPAATATKEQYKGKIDVTVVSVGNVINAALNVADVDATRSIYTLSINSVLAEAKVAIAAVNEFEKYKYKVITEIEKVRVQAIKEIEATGVDARIEELNEIVDDAVSIVENVTTKEQIDDAGSKILIILSLFHAGKELGFEEGKVSGLEEGKAETFGTLGTKQNGPAIIVTDQDGKEIILYSPKKVQYIKVTNK